MNFRFASFHASLTSIMMVDFMLRLISAVQYHLHTALLFTWTDYKTIFFPIVRFFLLSDVLFQQTLIGL
jgi:hypothetical protein